MTCYRQILCQELQQRSPKTDEGSNISEKRKSSDCTTPAPQTSAPAKDEDTKPKTESGKCEDDMLVTADIKKEEQVDSSSGKDCDSTVKKGDPVSSTASGDEEKSDLKNGATKNNNNNAFMVDLNQSPIRAQAVFTNPGLEYWRKKNPMADEIFITDVTVDLNTVTIRECATEKGFFRERQNGVENEDLKP